MNKNKMLLASLLIILLNITLVASLFGGGFDNNTVGLKSATMGRAFTGVADDSSAVFWNPAGMVFSKNKINAQAYGLFVWSDYKYTVDPVASNPNASRKNKSDLIFKVPGAFFSYNMGNMAFGIGCYVPYGGGGVEYTDIKGSGTDFKYTASVLAITPAFAYKLSPKLSVGVGLSVYYGMMTRSQTDPDLSSGTMLMVEQEHDLASIGGFGGNLGVFYKATDKLNLGFAVKSAVPMKITGKTKIAVTTPTGTVISPETEYDSEVEFTLPFYYTIGMAYKLTKKATVALDFTYMGWTQMNKIDATVKDVPDATGAKSDEKEEIRTEYNDSYYVGLGMDYKLLSNLSVRCGALFNKTPTRDKGLSPVSDTDLITLSLGGAYSITNQLEIGITGLYTIGPERKYENAKYDKDLMTLLAGLSFKL